MQVMETAENRQNNRMNVVIVRPDYDFDNDGHNIRPGYIQFSDDVPRFRTFAHAIGCEYIDSRTINIGGVDFDVIFDDEFMLKDEPRVPSICAMDDDGNVTEVVYGTAIICNNDGEDWTSLRIIDAAHVMNCVATANIEVHQDADPVMDLPEQSVMMEAAVICPNADPTKGQFVDIVRECLEQESGAETTE